jgi:RNA-binding protein Musashi
VDKVLKCPIHTLDGKKIDPKHATPKNRAKQANRTKKIFVGGVSQDTSSEEVKAYFNQFGKVEETVMLMDQQTKRHRGFGFVTFENEDVVDRVCEIHFHTIKNKKVECKKAQPKEAVQPGALALGKRVVLGALGVRLAPQPALPVAAAGVASQLVAQAQAQAQVQAAAAAAAAAQVQNAVAGYGKLFAGAYPASALSAYRYAPYPIPASAAAAAAAVAAAAAATPGAQIPQNPAAPQGPGQPQANSPAAGVAPPNPYQGYSLTNVDMSSFQGVDWGSMYGMGMYV